RPARAASTLFARPSTGRRCTRPPRNVALEHGVIGSVNHAHAALAEWLAKLIAVLQSGAAIHRLCRCPVMQQFQSEIYQYKRLAATRRAVCDAGAGSGATLTAVLSECEADG